MYHCDTFTSHLRYEYCLHSIQKREDCVHDRVGLEREYARRNRAPADDGAGVLGSRISGSSYMEGQGGAEEIG